MRILMKNIKKKNVIIILVIICGFALLKLAPIVTAATADSGTVIYDSTYIDALEANLTKQIADNKALVEENKALMTKYENEIANLKESIVFKIIKLPAGKTLIGDASTEIIVRNKDRVKAYVSDTATGGVSNLISGKDIKNGEIVPNDQLLLIPKADGRGITAKADADIMIKGSYTFK